MSYISLILFLSSSKRDLSLKSASKLVIKAVEDGDIVGVGAGNSVEKRRNAFENMLLEAESLIAAGMIPEACEQLHSANMHCNGDDMPRPNPKDFIEGDAVKKLNSMIFELMNSMGCPSAK